MNRLSLLILPLTLSACAASPADRTDALPAPETAVQTVPARPKTTADYMTAQEAQEYGGDPFHFRVTLFGTVTPSSLSWARKAVQQVKPVRSVLQDDIRIGARTTIQLRVRSGVKYIVAFPYAGEPLTGTVPKTAIGLKDAPNAMTISTEEWKASFPLCGEVTTE